MRRSDSIRQRTEQNGVGSHIDAVSLEILALTSITERGYWGIELGGHTQVSKPCGPTTAIYRWSYAVFFEQLLLQPLRMIELLDPWSHDITGAAGSSLLAGAIVLRFDQTAVVCTSPLRYMQSQSGTFIAVPGVDCMASLGCRLTLTTQEDADLMSPSALSRKVIAPKSWMLSTESITGATAPVLLLAAMEQQPQAIWSVKMRFLGGSYILAWRSDLDGCIEFAPLGHTHTIDRIAVHSPADAFGWLHPAYQHPFILDENCWRSAQVSDWPWPIRKALQSHHEPGKFYRDKLREALTARFRQAPKLRQRLLALRYPVQINDVPDGLIQEVAASLRKDSLAGLAR